MINKLKVLYEDNHIIVVIKPPNIPVQPDKSQDLDLLTIVKQYLKQKYQKPGNVYLGLVQRLDRPVGGVMVLARTSKAASRLTAMFKRQEVTRQYLGLVFGQLKPESGVFTNYLLKTKRLNKVKVVLPNVKGSKQALLSYQVLKYDKLKERSLVKINLITGRSHQIRVQFSYNQHPLLGDQKYGVKNKKLETIYLWATLLSFPHPISKEIVKFECLPPWYNLC